jgi:hypothetical protein
MKKINLAPHLTLGCIVYLESNSKIEEEKR